MRVSDLLRPEVVLASITASGSEAALAQTVAAGGARLVDAREAETVIGRR